MKNGLLASGVVGLVVFLGVMAFAYCALLLPKIISGGEFVTLSIAFAVIALIIGFSSQIQEFSIAGNTVKLREITATAQSLIQDLKAARTETFRVLLSLSERQSGGYSSLENTVDDRVAGFWSLHEKITRFDCAAELKQEITDFVEILLRSQIKLIGNSSESVPSQYPAEQELPSPDSLQITALDEVSIQQAAAKKRPEGNTVQMEQKIQMGLDEYRTLYELRKSLG